MCVELRGYRDIKGSCLACCPVSQQKVSRMGVAMIGCGVIDSFHLDAKMGPVACFSQNITKGVVSYHHITATLTSGGMMSQRVKALPGQSAYWDPWEVSIPSHHFMATSWTGATRCRPSPVMVEQTARMMHVVRKQKTIVLGQHWRRFPTAD